LIAIGNSGDVALSAEAERLLSDPSPLVRGAAVWALSKLLPRQSFAALQKEHAEPDPAVRDEWIMALA
jgi:epoxyqueuosine reductase